jgi:glutamate dehydrogenase
MEETKCILTIERKREEMLREKITSLNSMINSDESVKDKLVLESFTMLLVKRLTIEFMNFFSSEEIYTFIKNRFMFAEKSAGKETEIAVSPFLPDSDERNKGGIVLDMMMKDRPFIIDSLTEYLHEKKYNLRLMYYNVIEIAYTENGKLSDVKKGIDDAENSYTNVCCIINNFDPNQMEKLRKDVNALMAMIYCVTDDFDAISETVEAYTVNPEKGVSESLMESERRHLFAWFNAGNVILLGSGEVAKDDVNADLTWDRITNTNGFVRCKKDMNDPNLPEEIGRFGRYFLESGLKINLIETTELSMVHKKERIQILFGRKKDEFGNVKVNFFHILFTNKSLKEDALSIPLARLKVNSILDSHFEQDNIGGRTGHLSKMANDFFSIIPKRELFRLDRHELEAIYQQFVYFGDYQHSKISTYTQPSRNYARIVLCMPHHRFSQSIFEQIDKILSRCLGVDSEMKYWFTLGRNSYSHHIFWFDKDHPQLSNFDTDLVEKEVAGLTMGWEDEFQALLAEEGSEKTNHYQTTFSNVFGVFYQAVFTPQHAVEDVAFLDALLETNRDQVDLRPAPNKNESIIYIFSKNEYQLTEIMPHLQNLTLTVIDENTYSLNINGQQVFIYTYYVVRLLKQREQFPDFKEDFCELLLAVLEDETEDDVLNGLLLSSGLNMHEINLFILYRNYYWQIGAPYLPINKGFLENAEVMTSLRNYFYAKFQKKNGAYPLSDEELDGIKEETFKSILQVKTVAEDIIFKTIFNLMESTVRTNYFNIDELSTMAIKVKSAEVEQMPMPKPLYEIYVHGTHVEGIHLRGAMIARGGLRHSDRHDDFRTEILGLMNTQVLKNVVIVPDGSKGGFITKKMITDPQEKKEDAVRQYKRYINTLLSMTDNIVEGEVVPAPGLVRYDGDDPYFVVAADKGTATYSDIANEISEKRGFWLGDAFASGGQFGYDHKGMAITAKGGWESVKFHMLEDGIDIQSTDFTVVGIGDMSGDVFGNGMLLSKHIRLVGAFNHLHIFVDPNPDSAATWPERERLFTTPGTTWMDYDQSFISQGGGIFERSAKTIALTPEIQKLLGVGLESVSGEELIRLLLVSKVDLLWNGGIGTYIKASTETAHEVGDAANDAVRVDANKLKAKVIGEGGNLGLTQMARLEAAAKGIKLNTDAIDNSGGVDTSDHEVNLKILMSSLIEKNMIASADERNKLLEDLTDDITDLVLEDNRGQVQIMSMDNLRSNKDMSPFLDLIRLLAENGMDPRNETLSTSDQLEANFTKGLGVPRPDLAILLSYTKMYFYKEIVDSDVLDDPFLEDVYYSYFPETFRNQYDVTQIEHPLKKEIIGTVLVNRTINQAGITILPEIFSITDTTAPSIIIAYTIIDQIFQLGAIRKQIMSELRTSNLNQAYLLKIKLERFISDILIWMLLSYSPSELRFSLAKDFVHQVPQYRDALNESLDSDELLQLKNASENLKALGISSELADDMALLGFMSSSLEVIVQAKKSSISLNDAIVLSRGIDTLFHFQVLHNRIMSLELDNVWIKRHRGLLMNELQSLKELATESILNRYESVSDFDDKLVQFMKENQHEFKQYQIDYTQIVNGETVELSGIAILLDKIKKLLG